MTNSVLNDYIAEVSSIVERDVKNEREKKKILKHLLELQKTKINIMIVGGTGVGKSSTINALFETEKAKVGQGVDPETKVIEKYEMDNLVLWDTPGLGDSKEEDRKHTEIIRRKLTETDEDGHLLIDLVLVIVDGSSRDLGSTYQLINDVVIPYYGKENSSRIIIAINQADIAMKGLGHWDMENNCPKPELEEFLEQKVLSIKRRVFESTGVTVDPIYYSAGYKEGDKPQLPYNLSKLFYYMVKNLKGEKAEKVAIMQSRQRENFINDDMHDGGETYRRGILDKIVDGIGAAVEFVGDTVKSVGSWVKDTFFSWW